MHKYFLFLNTQCNRYLKGGEITDEEMHHLKIEFDTFISEAINSDLPIQLKNKIDELELNFEYKSRSEYGDLLNRLNLGSRRRELKQKNRV